MSEFKKGQKVIVIPNRVKTNWCSGMNNYIGNVLTIRAKGNGTYGPGYWVEENYYFWQEEHIQPVNNQTIVIYPNGLETISLLKEGKKVIKSANAKCNPSDTYDFEIGAKLAFSRLMGDEFAVKEIEVAHSASIDWEGFKAGKFAVHCDIEEKAKAFLKECDTHGIEWEGRYKASEISYNANYPCYHCSNGYLYHDRRSFCEIRKNIPIIDYATSKSTVKEVKRPAKVGEWIKIVNACHIVSDIGREEYKNGDVLKS